MRDAILALVREAGRLTFDELCARVPGAEGPLAFHAVGHPNVILWNGLSVAAIDALAALRRTRQIRFERVDPAVYREGRGVDFTAPIVPAVAQELVEPHWLPAVICANDFPGGVN